MLDNRFLIKTDGLDRKKAERAREGILFVLKMSEADPDLPNIAVKPLALVTGI